ncbi:5-methylcytosine-specific restriction protein A [Methylobacterium sp. OAE515]|uniref:HNH endonuclease n=1 Tax=Methylobacterium sp. OAE515 TaxID=2817895 RepID=UPI00178A87C1
MARREFSKATQREALNRSGYRCEAVTPAGVRCPAKVGRGAPVEYHHIVADTMGGEPTLENCAALCPRCHKIETALLASIRGKAQRRADAYDGVRDPHRRPLVSRGFTPPPPKPSPSRVPDKLAGLPRNTFTERSR